ncbi:MAG: rcc01693 family protein [Pseudomonadota bacterium]
MAGFDWPAMMRAGLAEMGLKPAEFWALTPVEFLLMSGAAAGPQPMRRSAFDALLDQFPDERRGPDAPSKGDQP